MVDPIVLLAQAAGEVAGPNGFDYAEGAGLAALLATVTWLIGVVRGWEKYQGLKEKYDSARGLIGGYIDKAQVVREMSDGDLSKVVAEKGLELVRKN